MNQLGMNLKDVSAGISAKRKKLDSKGISKARVDKLLKSCKTEEDFAKVKKYFSQQYSNAVASYKESINEFKNEIKILRSIVSVYLPKAIKAKKGGKTMKENYLFDEDFLFNEEGCCKKNKILLGSDDEDEYDDDYEDDDDYEYDDDYEDDDDYEYDDDYEDDDDEEEFDDLDEELEDLENMLFEAATIDPDIEEEDIDYEEEEDDSLLAISDNEIVELAIEEEEDEDYADIDKM